MNWKTTVVLLVIVVSLGLWVYYGESKTQKSKPGEDTNVFPAGKLESDAITKVVIDRGSGLKDQIVLVKEEKVGWKLEKPVVDRADDAKVREILTKIEFLTHQGHPSESQSFGEPVARITLTRGPNAEKKDAGGEYGLEIGAKFSDKCFARRIDKPGVIYTIDKALADQLQWDLFELRTKDLFTSTAIDAGKLMCKSPGDGTGPGVAPKLLELVKGQDKFWRIGGAGGELADSKKVSDLVGKVHDLKPSGIASDAPSLDDLAKFGLAQPAFEITLNAFEAPPPDPSKPGEKPQPKSETLQLGNEVEPGKDTRYALFSSRKFVYKVDASDALRELRKDPSFLRTDMLVPLHGGADGVTMIDARWSSGGKEVKLRKKDDEWTLEAPGTGRCEKDNVKALISLVAGLKIVSREGPDAGSRLAEYGLTNPGLTISLEEGGDLRVLQVGTPLKDKEGHFYVKRADEARVFVAKLGDIPEKLRLAPLAVRSKSLMKASRWDAVAVTLASPDGKTEVEIKKEKGDKWLVTGLDEKETDEQKVSKVIDAFADVKAQDLVAEVTSETQIQYGLDKPRKLTVTVEKWDSDAGAKKKSDTSLLLGKRDNDKVYAMEPNGTAIGRIDADFLERIGRGFRKGKELFSISPYDVASVEVKEGDKVILKIAKEREGANDEWSLFDASGARTKLLANEVREHFLDTFEKVEATRIENVTEALKKDRGLAPTPYRTITVHTKKAFGDKTEETKTILLGGKADEHDYWTMEEGAPELGAVFDTISVKIDAFLASPPKAPVASPSPAAPQPSPARSQAPPAPGASTPPAPKPSSSQAPGAMPEIKPPSPPATTPDVKPSPAKPDGAPVTSPSTGGGK